MMKKWGRLLGGCLAAMLLLSTGIYAEDEPTTEITAVEPISESDGMAEELPKVGDEYSSITILDGVVNEGDMPQFTDNLNQSTITATGANENPYFPFKIANVEENGQMLVAKSYEVPADVNANALIEGNVTRGDVRYKARDILQKKIKGEDATKTMRKPVTISSESKDKAKIMALLQPTIEYDEGGYHGTLTLESESITTEAAGTSTYNYELTDTKEYTGLERNDPSLVSKTVTKNGVTLNMSNIEWIPTGSTVSGDSVVQSYKAVVTYGGTAVGSKTSSYAVTAQYSGEVIKDGIGSCVYTIVYEPVKEIPQKFVLPKLPVISGQVWLVIFGVLAGLALIALLIIWSKHRKRRTPRPMYVYTPKHHEPVLSANKPQEVEKDPEEDLQDEFDEHVYDGGLMCPMKKTGKHNFKTTSQPLEERKAYDAEQDTENFPVEDEARYSGLYTDCDYVEEPEPEEDNSGDLVDVEAYNDEQPYEKDLENSLNWVSSEGFTVHDGDANAQAALELLNRMSPDDVEEDVEPADAEIEHESVEDGDVTSESNQEPEKRLPIVPDFCAPEYSNADLSVATINCPDEGEPAFAEPEFEEPEFEESENDDLIPVVPETDAHEADDEELTLPPPADFDCEPDFEDPAVPDEDMEVYIPADEDLPTISIDDDPELIEALQLNKENEDEK